jgi:hypothetical protein
MEDLRVGRKECRFGMEDFSVRMKDFRFIIEYLRV